MGSEGTFKHVAVTAGVSITALLFGMFVPSFSSIIILSGAILNPLMCFRNKIYQIFLTFLFVYFKF